MSNVLFHESLPVLFKSLFGKKIKNDQDIPYNRNHTLLGLNEHYGLKLQRI